MKNVTLFAVLAVAGATASVSSAAAVLSFGFTDLAGGYNAGTKIFSANAVNAGALKTGGDVSRLTVPGGTASFISGFKGLGTLADFTLNLNVFNKTATTALGAGGFTITDRNGDTIGGTISGLWVYGGGGVVFFNGALSNTVLTNNSGDGTFDGVPGGQFGMNMSGQPFDGTLVQLYINVGGGFLNSSFANVSTQVSGELVPTPGAIALLGLGGLVAGRRRR